MVIEKKNKIRLLGVLVVVLAGVALVLGGLGPQPDNLMFSWSDPTSGTEVVKYEVQIRVGGSASHEYRNEVVTTNSVTFDVEWLTPYEVRVRGVDANNRIGPWSDWSLAEDRDHEEPSF